MDTYRSILVIALIVLVALSGFFSAAETALTSFRSLQLEKLENEHMEREVGLLRKWLKSPNAMLTSILVGNNVVNILSSSIATVLTASVFGVSSGRSIVISTVVMTTIILIFGEITPKIIAKNYSLNIAKRVIGLVYILSIITKPVVAIFMFISKLFGRLCGIELKDSAILMTEEDIISFVNVSEEEGIIEEEEKEMIHSIVGFAEITAKEVMTPRTSVLAFEASKTVDEIWEEILENGFSRMPVYEDTIDDVIGVLYIKDIMRSVKEGKTTEPVKNFIRPAYFIPETKSIIEILKEFRTQHVHIAMVLDEYGGIVGIVTIEDLLEEIVGDIRDEYDTEEGEAVEKIDDNSWRVDAMIDIETLNDELQLNLPESDDYESLGGLILSELGKMASVGDEITLDGARLKVISLDKMRVSRVLVEKIGDHDEQDKTEGESSGEVAQ
ncbi:MAG: hemolysin family protein [Fusobacteriaceae bacterium]|nr:hemolysin family protein [Fusobacteriaceae bacterium]